MSFSYQIVHKLNELIRMVLDYFFYFEHYFYTKLHCNKSTAKRNSFVGKQSSINRISI